jgi:hypothetical protein
MEKRAGDAVGTSADRPGDDATNLTSYLLVLERNQLLRHHTVGSVYVKEDWRRGLSGWTHYAAILVENQSKQRYAGC